MAKYLKWSYDVSDYKPGDIIKIKSIPGSRYEVTLINGSFIYARSANYPLFASEIEMHEEQIKINERDKILNQILDGKN